MASSSVAKWLLCQNLEIGLLVVVDNIHMGLSSQVNICCIAYAGGREADVAVH